MKRLLILTVSAVLLLNATISSCPTETPTHMVTVPTSHGSNLRRLPIVEIKTFNELESIESVLTFDPSNITQLSGVTAETLELAISGTGLEGLGQAYIDGENAYHINAIFLLSVTALESGWGESPLAVKKNNVSGFRAYDSNPYDSATTFVTKSDSILRTSEVLSKEYVDFGLQSIDEIGNKYASDTEWASKVHSVALTIIKRIENNH